MCPPGGPGDDGARRTRLVPLLRSRDSAPRGSSRTARAWRSRPRPRGRKGDPSPGSRAPRGAAVSRARGAREPRPRLVSRRREGRGKNNTRALHPHRLATCPCRTGCRTATGRGTRGRLPTATRGASSRRSPRTLPSLDTEVARPRMDVCSEESSSRADLEVAPTSRSFFRRFVEKVAFLAFGDCFVYQVVPRPVREGGTQHRAVDFFLGPQLGSRTIPEAPRHFEPRLRERRGYAHISTAAPRSDPGTRDAPRARRTAPFGTAGRRGPRGSSSLSRNAHARWTWRSASDSSPRAGRLAGSTALPAVPPAAWVLPGAGARLPRTPLSTRPRARTTGAPRARAANRAGKCSLANVRRSTTSRRRARNETGKPRWNRNAEAAR